MMCHAILWMRPRGVGTARGWEPPLPTCGGPQGWSITHAKYHDDDDDEDKYNDNNNISNNNSYMTTTCHITSHDTTSWNHHTLTVYSMFIHTIIMSWYVCMRKLANTTHYKRLNHHRSFVDYAFVLTPPVKAQILRACGQLRPVHLLRVSLLRVLESNFPGDSL